MKAGGGTLPRYAVVEEKGKSVLVSMPEPIRVYKTPIEKKKTFCRKEMLR